LSTITYEYTAQRFSPREGSTQPLLLFVAPAGEIRGWAGVPRKAFDYQHGFQRTLQPNRIADVVRYYKDEKANFSPTSIVVGLTGVVSITPLTPPGTGTVAGPVETVRLKITIPNYEVMLVTDLINEAMAALKKRIPASTIDEIHANQDAAVAEASKLQEDDAVDESFGIDPGGMSEEEFQIAERSYLADFYTQLLGYSAGLMTLQSEEEDSLREVLYSILKPAMIVDGQHRVFGAATVDQGMLLAVCAIPDATWTESVYQFVVINQKAKPIKAAFLSSIIATSLSADEVAQVYSRLESSNIDVERSQEMNRVDTDPGSPFQGMIDFEVQGSTGFLQFPGMNKLVRNFKNIPTSHASLLKGGSWDSVKGTWIEHFFALWRGVKQYFADADARLWVRPSADNPNHLLMIVTLQELQGLMLDNWADSRVIKLGEVQATETAAHNFWDGFPSQFFTDEWRLKGLQTSVGRRILRDAVIETRRNLGRKNWGHRRLGLFS
jgi:hypothetical protein